jgi:curved DNA-binding protein CbpA
MKTLYELLGALPNDDAEGIRAAFRRAVKGAHPDLRPDDPDAALKFRLIVRANEMLGDAEQRMAYDHLLELARLEQEQASRQDLVANRIHKAASGVLAFAVVSIAMVGGYALFMHMSAASVAAANSANGVDVAMRAPVVIAAVGPIAPPDTTGSVAAPAAGESASPQSVSPQSTSSQSMSSQSASLQSASPQSASLQRGASPQNAGAPAETIGPSPAVVQANAASTAAAKVVPTPDFAADDARSLRTRGISAYRSGDLNTAIASLDQAIQLDPKFSAAYIDRGIIFYRLRKFERAFADIARAKRIEKRIQVASRSRSGPTMAERHQLDQAAIAPSEPPVPRRRTYTEDPSREQGFSFTRMR